MPNRNFMTVPSKQDQSESFNQGAIAIFRGRQKGEKIVTAFLSSLLPLSFFWAIDTNGPAKSNKLLIAFPAFYGFP